MGPSVKHTLSMEEDLEYITQTNGNFDFLDTENVFKFVDDASFLELVNLLTVGLSMFNCRSQVPSDLTSDRFFIPPEKNKFPRKYEPNQQMDKRK